MNAKLLLCSICLLLIVVSAGVYAVDDDADGVDDTIDNCPLLYNPSQLDTDGDLAGDDCDLDDDEDAVIDVADVCPLVAGLVVLNGCPDVDAPVLIAIIANASAVRTGDSLNMDIQVSDNVAVTSVVVSGVSFIEQNGVWQGSVVVSSTDLNVVASDGAGNQLQNTFTIAIDDVPPSISVLPFPDYAPAGTEFTIEFSAPESASTQVYGWRLDKTGLVYGVEKSVIGDTYTFSLSPSDGAGEIIIRAVDSVGNVAQQVFLVELDGTPPQFEGVSTMPSAVASGATFTLQVLLNDTRLTSVHVYNTPLSCTVLQSPMWSCTGVFSENGTLVLEASDAANNTATTIFNPLIDSVPPTIGSVSPLNNSILPTNTVTVSAFLRDTFSAFIHFEILVDAQAVQMGTVATNSTINATSGVLNDGIHSFSILATDDGANTARVDYVFTVDDTAPQISGISPSGGSFTNNTTVAMQFSVSDANPPISYSYLLRRLGGSTVVSAGATVLNNSSISFVRSGLIDGEYEFSIQVRDGVNNGANTSSLFTVDTLAPLQANLTIAAFAVNSLTLSTQTNELALCRYTLVENATYAEMNLFENSNALTHTATIGGLSPSTSYTVFVLCADLAGNVANQTENITASTAAQPARSSGGGGGGGGGRRVLRTSNSTNSTTNSSVNRQSNSTNNSQERTSVPVSSLSEQGVALDPATQPLVPPSSASGLTGAAISDVTEFTEEPLPRSHRTIWAVISVMSAMAAIAAYIVGFKSEERSRKKK